MPGGAGRSIPQRWEMRLGDQGVGRNEVKSQDFQNPSKVRIFSDRLRLCSAFFREVMGSGASQAITGRASGFQTRVFHVPINFGEKEQSFGLEAALIDSINPNSRLCHPR